MIESAQDYQLVTPVGVIDGGILPARDVEAGGLAHTVRAEDLCFAIEATRERDLYGQSMASSYPTPSLVLRKKDCEMVWHELRYVGYDGYTASPVPRVVDSEESFADVPYTAGAAPSTLPALFPNVYVQSCFGSVAGRNCVVDLTSMWRGFYYDLSRADRLQLRQSFNGSYTTTNMYGARSSNQVLTGTGGKGDVAPIAWGSSIIQRIGYYDPTEGYSSQRVRSAQYGVESASVSTDVPLPGLVTSAKLVGVYELYVQETPGRATPTVYYFTRAYNVSVSGSAIHVPLDFYLPQSSFDLLTVCKTLGHALPESYTRVSSFDNTGAYVQCDRSFLVANYNFRTNNLNSSASRAFGWNWTP